MKIRVSKGGFQFTDWKIAQSRSCFVQFASHQIKIHLLTPESYE